jgi:hypothetical protein
MKKSYFKNWKKIFNFAYEKTRILNIFIGSKVELSELSPTKNRIENDRLDDEKPSNQW